MPVPFTQYGFDEIDERVAEVVFGFQSAIVHMGVRDEGTECGLIARSECADLLGQVVGQAVAVVCGQERLARPECLKL